MISKEKYVPVLKCKAGEFRALNNCGIFIKDNLVPLVDLVPNPTKEFDDHIKSSLKYITNYWDPERLLYIDGFMIQDLGVMRSGIHPLEYIFNELSSQGFNAIPTIGNTTGLEYNRTVKSICEKDKKGVCVRIFRRHPNSLNIEIERLTKYLELDRGSIDLLIDMRSLEDLSINEIYNWSVQQLNTLNYVSEWRSLIISGGNFPIDLSELTPDQIHLLDRKEWINWKRLIENDEIDRIPTYADYAISHPLMSDFVGIPNASASIRYTQESEFYIYRGKGTRQYSFDQFYDLSESLINSPEYYGQDHCDGDRFIYNCGTVKNRKGSLMTWRKVGTIHHLTVVVNQLLQFFLDLRASRTS